MSDVDADVVVIGGGIPGLVAAYRLVLAGARDRGAWRVLGDATRLPITAKAQSLRSWRR